jgi:hypothetical protein
MIGKLIAKPDAQCRAEPGDLRAAARMPRRPT